MTEYLLFMVDTQQFGLPVSLVDHVIRMVQVTPLIAAPSAVAGIINFHGNILPVFSIRERFSFQDRPVIPEDILIITISDTRSAALIADQVSGVVEISDDMIHAEDILPGITGIQGVLRNHDGMILITDLNRFLLPEEEKALQQVLPSGAEL